MEVNRPKSKKPVLTTQGRDSKQTESGTRNAPGQPGLPRNDSCARWNILSLG